jgi:hypothetical protein
VTDDGEADSPSLGRSGQIVHRPFHPRVEVGEVALLAGDLVQVRERQEGGHRVDGLISSGKEGEEREKLDWNQRSKKGGSEKRDEPFLEEVPFWNRRVNQPCIVSSISGSPVFWYERRIP